MGGPTNGQVYQQPPMQQTQAQSQQPQYQSWPAKDISFTAANQLPPTAQPQQPAVQPASPASGGSLSVPRSGPMSRRNSETLVYHSLEIPRCISPNGGNLAELAAQMTCLFWFESNDELKQAESIRSRPANAPIVRLPKLAKPDEQFRKWTLSVLSTTQVTQNVILLALLFIYRLKMSSPHVKGKGGSECRLLVIALMLGNKFLDDNTYTNKTWAEVSQFDVKEIHVMEVEFLSNMRYNLLASKQEWDEWLEKLACFREYYERALRLPASPVPNISPKQHVPPSPIHSPTNGAMPDFGPVTPTVTNNFSPASVRSQQNWPAYQANNNLSPLAGKPAMNLMPSRKRSFEEDPSDHPAKRLVPSSRIPQSAPAPGPSHPSARLSAPSLTLVTNQQQPNVQNNSLPPLPMQTPYSQNGLVAQTTAPAVQNHVSLPPLQPGMRAMSTVYQQPGPSSMPPQQIPASAPSLPQSNFTGPTLPSHTPMSFNAGGKNRSPGSLAPFSSSPMPDHFGNASGVHTPMVHTPISNSPSFYLQQRNSPYKPIRHVNTLLYPGPPSSLDQYHLQVPIPPNQMHYQPLGRRNDVRTGVVPEFLLYNRGLQHQQPPHQLPSQLTPHGPFPG